LSGKIPAGRWEECGKAKVEIDQITNMLIEQGQSIEQLRERTRTLFNQQNELKDIAQSTYKLALSVEKLVQRVDETDRRLSNIEETARNRINTIWACVTTGIIGAIISFIVSSLL